MTISSKKMQKILINKPFIVFMKIDCFHQINISLDYYDLGNLFFETKCEEGS